MIEKKKMFIEKVSQSVPKHSFLCDSVSLSVGSGQQEVRLELREY